MTEKKNFTDELNDKIDHAKEEVKEAAKRASEKAEDFTEEAKESAKDFAEEAKETAKEFASGAKETFDAATGENKKLLAGLMGIFFGGLGLHKFVLGYTKEGVILLIASILTCGVASIIGFIEGIIYLTKSDQEFYSMYQVNKKPWF